MYKCNNCGKDVDIPETVMSTWEEYYGVAGSVSGRTPMGYIVCPYCNDEDIERMEEDSE